MSKTKGIIRAAILIGLSGVLASACGDDSGTGTDDGGTDNQDDAATDTPGDDGGEAEAEAEDSMEEADQEATDCTPGTEEACPDGIDTGECVAGWHTCGTDGAWLPCRGQVVPVDELCDELDNDCDDETDEGAATAPTWYADADGDTYGDPETATTACTAPAANVDNSGDCDDADSEVSPAASEVCDGVDNDCDGTTDDGVAPVLADIQEGVCAGTVKVCSGVGGWVEPDYAAVVEHYEALETRCDGLDNNCDGELLYGEADGDEDGDGVYPCYADELFAVAMQSFGSMPGMDNYGYLEVMDLRSGATVLNASLGNLGTAGMGEGAESIAVAPDGSRAYIAASGTSLLVYDMASAAIMTVPVPGVRDLVITADGATLFATAGNQVVAIDTTALTTSVHFTVTESSALSLALSADGTTLATVTSESTAYIAGVAAGSTAVRIPVSGTSSPNAVAFGVDDSRLLVWNSNSDQLVQIDVAAGSELAGATISFTTDAGSSFNFNNSILYNSVRARGYVMKESQEVMAFDPVGLGYAALGFDGMPFVVGQPSDESTVYASVIHRFSGGGADTLSRIAVDGIVTNGVLTFPRTGSSVRDFQIVRVP